MSKAARYFILIIVVSIFSSSLYGQEGKKELRVLLAVPSTNNTSQSKEYHLANRIAKTIPTNNNNYFVGAANTIHSGNYDAAVAITDRAVEELQSLNYEKPVISLFSSSKHEQSTSRIKTDPWIKRQNLLLAAILKDPRCGVIGPATQEEFDLIFEGVPMPAKSRYSYINATNISNMNRLVSAASTYDCILLTKNKDLYKRFDIASLIERLYEYNNQPVIVFSPKLVGKTAALSTTHSTLNNIGEEIANRVKQFQNTHSFPPSGHTDEYSIKYNEFIGRSLNLPFTNSTALKAMIDTAMEGQN